jgi:hypothetical protein
MRLHSKANWLMLLREIIASYSQNYMKHTNAVCVCVCARVCARARACVQKADILNFIPGCTYSNHHVLKG